MYAEQFIATHTTIPNVGSGLPIRAVDNFTARIATARDIVDPMQPCRRQPVRSVLVDSLLDVYCQVFISENRNAFTTGRPFTNEFHGFLSDRCREPRR